MKKPNTNTRGANRAANIKDVALAAGVSTSTVSKVLSSRGYSASAATVEKVHRAAKKLDYVPDSNARNLRNQRSGQIGIVLNELDASGPSMALRIGGLQLSSVEITQISFDGAILAGLTSAIRRHKQDSYSIYPQPHDPATEDISKYLDRRVEGLIVRTDPRQRNRIIHEVSARTVPMIALWSNDVPPGVGYSDIDHLGGAVLAVEHLLSLGHRRIAYFGDGITSGNHHFATRHRGYLETMQQAGAENLEQISSVSSASQLTELMKGSNPVTAVFAPTDLQAGLLAQDLSKLGVRIPQDISMVGFDDIFGSDFIAGGLTTIYHPVREMAELAVDNLMALIRGEPIAKCRTVLPTRLVVRASTRKNLP